MGNHNNNQSQQVQNLQNTTGQSNSTHNQGTQNGQPPQPTQGSPNLSNPEQAKGWFYSTLFGLGNRFMGTSFVNKLIFIVLLLNLLLPFYNNALSAVKGTKDFVSPSKPTTEYTDVMKQKDSEINTLLQTYVDLQKKYDKLQDKYNDLQGKYDSLLKTKSSTK